LEDKFKNKLQLIAELEAARGELAKLKEKIKNISITEERKNSFREVIWGYVSIKCIKSREGKVVHYFAMIQDVTDKKKVERAGNDLRIRYHNLFENSPISLWERDDSELCRYFDTLGVL